MLRSSIPLALLVALSACAEDAGARSDVVDAAQVVAPDAAQGEQDAGPLATCAAFGGAEPRQVADVVARLNALPEPTLNCLLASLPRPLSLVASLSVSSLQPAAGANSPRIFILFGDALSLSVVPDGEGSDQLEFGEFVDPRNTLKAELRFPLSRPIPAETPYLDLTTPGQSVSSCGFCHRNEQAHPTIDGAFVSDAIRPAPLNEMAIDELRAARIGCEREEGPHCAMLRALFDYGEVRQGAFDRSLTAGF